MRPGRRRFLHLAAAAAAVPFAPYIAGAEAYPAHPVRLLVGFPAGGQIDIIARITGQWLGKRLGQSIIVENKPGVGGSLGAEAVVKAAPDGYTLFFGAASNTVNTSLIATLPYDFARDTTAIAPINRIALVLEAHPSFEPKTVAAFIAAAKAKPGSITMGSPSAGTPPYLAVDLLKLMAGIDLVHVPYLGESQMMTDLVGGHILVGIGGISSSIGDFQAGKLRPLGVTTPTRIAQLPDVPAIAETVPGFDASGWSGIVGPKNMPKDIVETLAAAVKDIQADPAFKDRLTKLGVGELSMTPDEFSKFIASETAKWAKVVKFAGLKPK